MLRQNRRKQSFREQRVDLSLVMGISGTSFPNAVLTARWDIAVRFTLIRARIRQLASTLFTPSSTPHRMTFVDGLKPWEGSEELGELHRLCQRRALPAPKQAVEDTLVAFFNPSQMRE